MQKFQLETVLPDLGVKQAGACAILADAPRHYPLFAKKVAESFGRIAPCRFNLDDDHSGQGGLQTAVAP